MQVIDAKLHLALLQELPNLGGVKKQSTDQTSWKNIHLPRLTNSLPKLNFPTVNALGFINLHDDHVFEINRQVRFVWTLLHVVECHILIALKITTERTIYFCF